MGTVAQVPWAVSTEVDRGVGTGVAVVTDRLPAGEVLLPQAVRPVIARATPAIPTHRTTPGRGRPHLARRITNRRSV